LTLSTPKPLLPIANVRQLEHLIAHLSTAGVTNVALAIGFKPEPFFEAFPDGICAGVKLHYAVEPEPLDTAGAIAFAARDAGITETFVVMNGDILCDVDVAALVSFHKAQGVEGTLHVTPVNDPSQYGVVEISAEGKVQRFVEKPAPGESESNVVNAGIYVLEPSVIDRIPKGQKISIERKVFILSSVGTNAHIDASASITHSVIGEGCVIGAGCVVIDSVLLPGAVLGDRVRLERSMVMGSVSDESSLTDCVIGAGVIVPPGEHLQSARVPDPEQKS
jgi:mannose-1-phosphate guanylyltransferase